MLCSPRWRWHHDQHRGKHIDQSRAGILTAPPLIPLGRSPALPLSGSDGVSAGIFGRQVVIDSDNITRTIEVVPHDAMAVGYAIAAYGHHSAAIPVDDFVKGFGHLG